MDDNHKKFGDLYKMIDSIGKGSFGSVYKVIDKSNRAEFASKVEKRTMKERLTGEYRIYKIFKKVGLECVPNVKRFFATKKYNIMVMDLLGKSLDEILNDEDGKLDIGTVMKIGIELVKSMKLIHKAGIIHRDIKPNNFMFGKDENRNKLYVMDFGLSKKWYNKGNHIEYKDGRSMIGTTRYASTNIHMGIEPSRRDDIESIGYMLVYLIKGRLPWQGLMKKTKDNPIDKIGDKKININLKKLCDGIPKCFYEFIRYAKKLEFDEKPDYEYLINIIKKSAEEENIQIKYFFE